MTVRMMDNILLKVDTKKKNLSYPTEFSVSIIFFCVDSNIFSENLFFKNFINVSLSIQKLPTFLGSLPTFLGRCKAWIYVLFIESKRINRNI